MLQFTVISLLVGVVIVIAWGLFSSSVILSVSRSANDKTPQDYGRSFENLTIKTKSNFTLQGWFVPSNKSPSPLIFVLHGWGGNRCDVLPLTIHLADKFHLVYFDFHNHGESSKGPTSLTGLEVADFVDVVEWINQNKKGTFQSLGAFGLSMGGAVAISGSAEIPDIKAVLAESSFASYRETVALYARLYYHAPRFLVPITLAFVRWRLKFDPEFWSPLYKVGALSPRPLLIFQGGSDPRVPISDGEMLLNAAGQPKEIWIAKDADHGKIHEQYTQEYEERMRHFFERNLQ